MICPTCGSEYRDGYVRCESCDADLVVEQPAAEEHNNTEPLVRFYETGNAAIIPVLESVLDDAGIEYMTKGEPIQDLFGWGRLGTNLNFVIGRSVEFYVNKVDEAAARELVETLEAQALAYDESKEE